MRRALQNIYTPSDRHRGGRPCVSLFDVRNLSSSPFHALHLDLQPACMLDKP